MSQMGMLARLSDDLIQDNKKRLTREKERVDRKMPLGVRLGDVITLDSTPFVLAAGQLLVECPEGALTVKAIGYYDFQGIKYYRIYLDHPLNDDSYFITLGLDKNGEVQETIFFRECYELYPQNEAEWAEWLEEGAGHIGHYRLNLPDGTAYTRIFESDDENAPDWIAPVEFEEKVTDDAYLTYITKIEHASMLYGRGLITSGGVVSEYVWSEKQEYEDGAMVVVSIGVPVEPTFVIKI